MMMMAMLKLADDHSDDNLFTEHASYNVLYRQQNFVKTKWQYDYCNCWSLIYDKLTFKIGYLIIIS